MPVKNDFNLVSNAIKNKVCNNVNNKYHVLDRNYDDKIILNGLYSE